MALTYSPTTGWAERTEGKFWVASQAITNTTSETDVYTTITPTGLDGSKPWMLMLTYSATLDTGQTPNVELWVANDRDAVLSSESPPVPVPAGSAYKYREILDDSILAVSPIVYVWQMDPELPVAEVVTVAAINTGLKLRCPAAPGYFIVINGDSTASAGVVTTVTIMQQR